MDRKDNRENSTKVPLKSRRTYGILIAGCKSKWLARVTRHIVYIAAARHPYSLHPSLANTRWPLCAITPVLTAASRLDYRR